MKPNPSAVPVADKALGVLLVGTARDLEVTGCTMPEGDCEGCQYARHVWWDTLKRLRPDVARTVVRVLNQARVPLPDVAPDAEDEA